MAETRIVHLREDLCSLAEEQYATRFATIEELLTEVLTELTRIQSVSMDEAELRLVEQRLADLGYL